MNSVALSSRSLNKSGFSTTELMIYILIVGILMAITVPAFFSFIERGRRSSTEQTLRNVQNAILFYNGETGKYPARLEDLVEKPKGDVGKKWTQQLPKMPKDGWGNEFYYRVTSGGKHAYELYSTGGSPEGEEDPEKQISVWDL